MPVLQRLPLRLSDRNRHGLLQGRGLVPELSRPAAAGVALLARLAAALGQTGLVRTDAANGLLKVPGLRHAGLRLAGVDARRGLPQFALETFDRWFRNRDPSAAAAPNGPVLLWADTFTNYFSPEIGQAAVRVLERAGYEVLVPDERLCCGLTWISTGQLDTARGILGRTVDALAAYADAGVPVLGLEPSCTAVLRSDALELLGGKALPVAQSTRTLAELLAGTQGWTPPSLMGEEIVAQPHCHHHAVLGWGTDLGLLRPPAQRAEPGRVLRTGRKLRRRARPLRRFRGGRRDPIAASGQVGRT